MGQIFIIDQNELLEVCHGYKKFYYCLHNLHLDTRTELKKCVNINKIIKPDKLNKVKEIRVFPSHSHIDIDIEFGIEKNNVNSVEIVRLLLHSIDLKI